MKEFQYQRKIVVDLKNKLNKINVLRILLGEIKIVLKLVYNWDGWNDQVLKNLYLGFVSVFLDMVLFFLRERNFFSFLFIG